MAIGVQMRITVAQFVFVALFTGLINLSCGGGDGDQSSTPADSVDDATAPDDQGDVPPLDLLEDEQVDATVPVPCGTDGDCPTGQYCKIASGTCAPIAICAPDCAAPTPVCEKDGTCVGCGTLGCPPGEDCDAATGECVKAIVDPCANITCQPGLECDPETQMCAPVCDVVDQNCKNSDDNCTVLNTGAVGCELAGTTPAGEVCGSGNTDDCAKGSMCAGGTGGYSCLKLCNAEKCQGCGQGYGCVGLGDGQGNQIPGAGVCVETGTSCDVVGQDCPGDDLKCTLVTGCGDTACVQVEGDKQEGEYCNAMAADECAPGLICLQMGPACFTFCYSNADCSAGTDCYPFSEYSNVGHCMGGH